MANKRNVTLDIAKGIGIVLVVIAHAGMPHSAILNHFHMAFFFFLSGMTVSERYLDNLKMVEIFIWKRIKRLYIPFVCFNGLVYLLYNQLIKINIFTDNPKFLEPPTIGGGNSYGIVSAISSNELISKLYKVFSFMGENQLGGALWFLRVLFEVACTWIILNWVLKTLMHLSDDIRIRINIVVSVIFILLAFSLQQKGVTLLYGQYEIVMASYWIYFMGIYCGMAELKTSRINEVSIMILSFVMLILCNNICLKMGWNCSVQNIGNPYMFVVTSTLGTLFGYFLARILVKVNVLREVLAWLGRHSLFILLFHFTAFKLITLIECCLYDQPLYRIASFPFLENGKGWWLAYSIVGLALPAFIGTIWISFKNKIYFSLLKK